MKYVLIILVLLVGVNYAQEAKLTKAQQEIVDKAKPIEAELKELKSQVYDMDKLVEYYSKLKADTNKKIEEKVLALQELQKQFDALAKKEEK